VRVFLTKLNPFVLVVVGLRLSRHRQFSLDLFFFPLFSSNAPQHVQCSTSPNVTHQFRFFAVLFLDAFGSVTVSAGYASFVGVSASQRLRPSSCSLWSPTALQRKPLYLPPILFPKRIQDVSPHCLNLLVFRGCMSMFRLSSPNSLCNYFVDCSKDPFERYVFPNQSECVN